VRLDHWADSARAQDRDGWIAAVKAELRGVVSPEAFDSFVAAVPLDQAYVGCDATGTSGRARSEPSANGSCGLSM